MLSKRSFFFALASMTALAGCASSAVESSDEPEAGDAPDWVSENYELGSGDKIRITVFNETALSGEFTVSATGSIAMPLIGEIPASGRTIEALQRDIETGLRDGYVLNPRVSAEVLTYRPFYILGEVGNPGTYPYSAGLTVVNAVATAGGFTYRANTRRVYIRRANTAREMEYRLTNQTRIAPGDTVRIGERLF